jgi:hypothetical protein
MPRHPLQSLQPRPLQGWGVIGVEIVEPDQVLAALQQLLGHGSPDEAGGAGDQDGSIGHAGGELVRAQ